MDKNKTILVCIAMICVTIAFVTHSYFASKYHNIKEGIEDSVKGKELEIGIFDQYTYCLRSVMNGSNRNGKPCSAQDAEKICQKFNK